MREITLAGHRIADETEPFVVAEIGHNHQGDVEIAEQIIRAAAIAGADAVKLQKRDNRTLYTREEFDAPYNSENAFGPTYGSHREALEFGFAEYTHLKAFAESFGLVFFATAFDVPSIEFLARLNLPVIKIGSGQVTNRDVLVTASQVGCPLIVSTGGCTLLDVIETARILREQNSNWALLQCTSLYPCPAEQLNLRVIELFREQLPEVVIGLSDHYDGISMGPPAYMLGARIFEKHFTLSRSWKGSDQAFSLEPEGLRRFVRDLKATRMALGQPEKLRIAAEIPALRKMGRRDI